jgi:hypothetical protein
LALGLSPSPASSALSTAAVANCARLHPQQLFRRSRQHACAVGVGDAVHGPD